jgi:hypothetical protein
MGNGLLLQEILDHFEDVAIIVMAEVEAEVPCVVEGDRLVRAGAADYLGEDLSCKIVTYN